jgi:two-component system response regulator CpxR
MMESILIIDDDISLCSMLKEYFALHKMKLAMSHHGLSGLEEAGTGNYDLILLDVMLPGIDGLQVLRLLRNVSDVSILLLTARAEVDDRINGLESGADDYVAKPFNPRELVARIRSILRRRAMTMDLVVRTGNRKISVHGFELDIMARSAEYRGTSLSLTETEFALLEVLLESPGVILGRELLSDRISRRPFHPLDRSLDMLVCRLRRKLDIQDNPGQAIRTIRSNGYVFKLPEKKVSRPPMLNSRALESA